MDKEKIYFTISCIKQVYGLSDSVANLLLKNIVERVKLYKDTQEYVDASNDLNSMYPFKSIDNKYTLEDFLLNRLLFNIRLYDMDYDITLSKGAFIPTFKELHISNYKELKLQTADILKEHTSDNNIIEKSTIKVFNHEIGHALQTRYTSGQENFQTRNEKYFEVINLLKQKYPNINNYRTPENSKYKTGGLRFVDYDTDTPEKAACRRYQTSHVLDEILNEEEALNITGCNSIQRQKKYGNDGDYRNIYNYESSNCYVTCYANMIKSLIGNKMFDYMYLNDDGLIKSFEKYRDIANSIYQDKLPENIPVLSMIIFKLENIKSLKNNNEQCREECMKLDLFFAKCIEKYISYKASKIDKLPDKTYNMIISHIDEMQNAMLTNDDINKRNNLPQHKVLNELRMKLKQFNENYNISTEQTQTRRM